MPVKFIFYKLFKPDRQQQSSGNISNVLYTYIDEHMTSEQDVLIITYAIRY